MLEFKSEIHKIGEIINVQKLNSNFFNKYNFEFIHKSIRKSKIGASNFGSRKLKQK